MSDHLCECDHLQTSHTGDGEDWLCNGTSDTMVGGSASAHGLASGLPCLCEQYLDVDREPPEPRTDAVSPREAQVRDHAQHRELHR